MNQAALEICRILLEFEVERIERQQKAVAAGVTRQDAPAATALVAKSDKPTRRVNHTRLAGNGKNGGV